MISPGRGRDPHLARMRQEPRQSPESARAAHDAVEMAVVRRNKPLNKCSPAGTNDPHVRYCDADGFPRNMTNQIRGMTITTSPEPNFHPASMYGSLAGGLDRRTKPADQCRRQGRDTLDPEMQRLLGGSLGKTTTPSWSIPPDSTRIPGRPTAAIPMASTRACRNSFHRDSRNDLTLTITMDDPKLYTKPFDIGDVHFRGIRTGSSTTIPASRRRFSCR